MPQQNGEARVVLTNEAGTDVRECGQAARNACHCGAADPVCVRTGTELPSMTAATADSMIARRLIIASGETRTPIISTLDGGLEFPV